VTAHVSTASGHTVRVPEGSRLVFGRGPAVDLVISAGRGLSRRAGVVSVLAAGAWIANISHTHALYVEGDGYRIRLPRLENDGEPAGGWFVRRGTALVGSRAMLDDGQPLTVLVPQRLAAERLATEPAGAGRLATEPLATEPLGAEPLGAGRLVAGRLVAERLVAERLVAERLVAERKVAAGSDPELAADSDGTLLPLYLDPMTKLFLVALMWCRPWLLDPSATTPLPRTPEIAKAALEVTGAYHELERFETDQEYHDRLSARVAEHLKVLRRKITDRGLTAADVRLSDEVAVRALIEHGIVTTADLTRLTDPAWCSRQEDLWWAST